MRLGKIQKALIEWMGNRRVYIGASSVRPPGSILTRYYLEEVLAAADRLVARGILISDKPGFYSLNDPTKENK